MSPIDKAMRDFAVKKLNEEVDPYVGPFDPPVIGVQIFGWNVFRVFRDDKKEMIKIVLEKDGVWKEFENTNWRKRIENDRRD